MLIGAGRRYKAVMEAISVSALQDLWEILAPTDAIIVVQKVTVFQTSDLGDSEEEVLRFQCVRGVGSVTSGSGGSAVTPQQIENGDTATGATVERNNTTRMAAGSGSLETLDTIGWNVRIPENPLIYLPEELGIVSPGDRWTFGLPAAPTDALTFSSTILFTEIGG